MSDQLFVAFLWHMHQPWYLDPATGGLTLPWVRLHAAKDYVDMVELLAEFPAIHQTFNLTPCLLDQVAWYTHGGMDAWELLAARPTDSLSPSESASLARQCTFAHPQRMVAPHPRFYALFAHAQRGQRLTVQELRDLTVWFNLIWIDPRWRAQDPALASLLARGRGFTEAEKHAVLAVHRMLLARVIPAYRAAVARGQIEVATSPYAHPILPLLMDTAVARQATPGLPLPPTRFSYPEDAVAHLRRATEVVAQWLGHPPRGVWPSEGAVSDPLVPLVAQQGFHWVATDEAMLWRSLGGSPPRSALYQPYRRESPSGPVSLVFRDHTLSDLIGFTYAQREPAEAVEDFLDRLRRIQHEATSPAPLVTIALDGENAWEHYPHDGQEFLTRLYEALSREPGISCVTVSESLTAHPPDAALPSLAAGSWIRGDFTTWIGDGEKNRAWELLGQTRAAYEAMRDHPKAPEAFSHLMIAEGSDWFWWFGPEHTSAHDEEFDRLFRQRLAQVYTVLGVASPEAIHRPIVVAASGGVVAPTRWGTPVIDGVVTDYFEWLSAGRLECAQHRGAMAPGQDRVQRLWWLCDRERLFLRWDLATWPSEIPMVIVLAAERPAFTVEVVLGSGRATATWAVRQPDGTWGPPRPVESLAVGHIVECGIPLAALGVRHGMGVVGRMQVREGDAVVETIPGSGTVTLMVPKETDAEGFWSA